MRIRFGPSGNSKSFYDQGYKSTDQAPAWLSGQGLDAFEYSFGRGVRISKETAQKIGEKMKQFDVQLSVHAPYYINFASVEEKIIQSSWDHLVKTAQACRWLGGKRIVFHPGVAGVQRTHAIARIHESVYKALYRLDAIGYGDLSLCPETMGKINQIGDLDETIALCALDERLIPCIDFGHLYARSLGAFGSCKDYADSMDKLEKYLGLDRARQIHVHFSRIEYSQGGEKRHLNYDNAEFGPDFEPLAEELFGRRYTPVIICESKTKMAEDAATYRQIYQHIERKNGYE